MRPLFLSFTLLPCLACGFMDDAKPDHAAVLAPYLDDATLFVARLDAAKLEPKKLAPFLTKTGFVSRDIDRQGLEKLIQQTETLLAAAKAKGVRSVYAVARFEPGLDRANQVLPFMDVFFICPLAAGGDPAGVIGLLPGRFERLEGKPGDLLHVAQEAAEKGKYTGARTAPGDMAVGYRGWLVKDGTLVVGPGRIDLRLARRKPRPQPQLLAALAKGEGAVATLAFAPSKDQTRAFRELMPKLPAEIGGDETRVLLDGCAAATLTLDQDKPALRLSISSSSPEAAAALEKWLKTRYAQVLAIPEARRELPFLVGGEDVLLPKASGAGLTLECDPSQPRLGELARSLGAKITANRASDLSGSRMRDLMIAMHNFHTDFFVLPSNRQDRKTGRPLLSWRVALLPYLEQSELYGQFKIDEPWDSEHNKKLLARMPKVFRRPPTDASLFGHSESRTFAPDNPEQVYRTPYLAPIYPGTVFAEPKPISFGKLTQGDGTSNTIALVEVDDAHMVPWTKPDDWDVSEERGAKDLFVWPDGRTNFAFFDASVKRAKPTMPFKILKQLIGWNDGLNEDIQPWFGK